MKLTLWFQAIEISGRCVIPAKPVIALPGKCHTYARHLKLSFGGQVVFCQADREEERMSGRRKGIRILTPLVTKFYVFSFRSDFRGVGENY